MPVKDVHSDGLSCFASRKSWFSQLLGHARGPDCKVLLGSSDLLFGVLTCGRAQAFFEQVEELS